ncbi:MAG: TrmB family transcriptional regulator [Thaumarchaeota archaeon]|nr:TrmB family transcriptional regulator [Nitrososphaerota archaeon]
MQADFASIFDSKMAENNLFKKVTELFSKFGLSQYESYIYIFLAKNGRKTASQIYKTLRMPKTETYRILTKLQGRGLVTSSFGHPMTYTAPSINKVVELLINQERNRINDLEAHKQELIDLFHKIPSFGSDTSNENSNQFQILHGRYQINNKIKEMLAKAKTKFLLIGSENEFVQFYQDSIFELLKNSKLNIKILSSDSKKVRYFFQYIKKECIKIISEKYRRNLCFAIKDDDEIVFFMKNGSATKEKIAIWSDSTPFVTPLDLLFNIIWHSYKSTKEAGKYDTLEKTQQEYKFKIKELEQENIALTTLNRLLSNKD